MDGLAGAAPMDKMKDRLKEWLDLKPLMVSMVNQD